MNLSVHGTRPVSSRSQSRINPITGEDMALTTHGQSQSTGSKQLTTSQETYRHHAQTSRVEPPADLRPTGVPRLNLRQVVGREEDERPDYTLIFDEPHGVQSSSRDSTSRNFAQIASFRVPPAPVVKPPSARHESKHVYTSTQPKQPTAWDRTPVPEDLVLPSQRYRDQYQQLQRETAESYRRKVNPVQQKDVEDEIHRLRINVAGNDEEEDGDDQSVEPVDQVQERLYANWTATPYSKQALHKLRDKEDMEEEKRKSKMLETVLIDQLCRPVISDPGQSNSAVQPKAQQQQQQSYRPGMKRGSVRTLHDSKVKTDGSSTEVLLSRRVRFESRVLSLFGRDAIRELTGFFFAADNTLTVYEFRQFGKTSKAMPFIKRGRYYCMRGGQPTSELYTLADIIEGNDIVLETADQPLPDSAKANPIITLRICDVDVEAKKSILLSGVPAGRTDELWKRLQFPSSPELMKAKLLMLEIHDITKRQIGKRGIKVFTGIGRLLRKGDLNGDGLLNKFELEKSLVDFHVNIPQSKFDDLWDILDPESDSFLHYDKFMRAFIGEMNEYRKSYVIKVFSKVDAGRRGSVTFGDIRKFYNANKHPKVKTGECSEDEIVGMFLDSFANTLVKGELTFREFEEYYEGLSMAIDEDDDFINILKNAWSI